MASTADRQLAIDSYGARLEHAYDSASRLRTRTEMVVGVVGETHLFQVEGLPLAVDRQPGERIQLPDVPNKTPRAELRLRISTGKVALSDEQLTNINLVGSKAPPYGRAISRMPDAIV